MGKKKKPVAMLPNLEVGDQLYIGKSVYEFSKIKDINTEETKLVFTRVGPIKDA